MIKDSINNDLKQAMLSHDKKIVAVLRYILSAIKQIEVDERIVLTDDRVILILDKVAKQHRESIAQFSVAGRTDLVDIEEFELQIVKKYLPAQLSEIELEQLVNQTIEQLNASNISDVGKVISSLKSKIQGRCDMSFVNMLVKSKLS